MARVKDGLGWEHIFQDAIFVAMSLSFALVLARSSFLSNAIGLVSGAGYVGAFVVGILFTSIFTTAPAMVILGKLSLIYNPIWIILIGASGAMLGDLLIFRLVHKRLRSEAYSLAGKVWARKMQHIFHKKIYRRFAPFMAAIIIASPLPDELGLTLVGMTEGADDYFAFFSLVGNAVGIALVCLGASALV